MKMPPRLLPLYQAELIDEVVGQLQSGKEAEVYVVRTGNDYHCAKVYKESNHRTFKHRTQYTEGRQVRGSRRGRAMDKKSRYGRQEQELEWQNTEVEALFLLGQAGVQVPKAFTFYEGVLLLEMLTDRDGDPAPRLTDVEITADQARTYHLELIRQAVLMLCSGIVHGDLSEFNVLVANDKLYIIDFPQAVQATANNAFQIFERDLKQLANFFGQYDPDILLTDYPKEIWKLYQNGKLKPDSPLTGRVLHSNKKANLKAVLDEISDAKAEALEKRSPKK